MQLRIIEDVAALHSLREEWDALAHTQRALTPFQLPVWLLTWWQYFGSGTLQVFTFREGGRLVGIIPSFLHEWNGRRQLTLMGTGLSDWTDPILPTHALPVLEQHLEICPAWQVINWQDLSASSPLARLTGAETSEDDPCTEALFTGTFEDFWAQRGKDLRRNIRRYGDKARTRGAVEFTVAGEATVHLLDDLVRLHTNRWQEQGQSGMIVANSAEPFLRAVAERLAEEGLLRILCLRLNGQMIAMNFGIVLRNDYYGYMSAFHPEYDGFGPGKLLLYEAFRYCCEHGIKSWQFLRGQETYKKFWGAQVIPKIRVYKAR